MPLLSVIVPVYNVENYLKKCVNSILNQTFTDYEVLLIDDGSTDDSSAICDDFATSDSRIKVFHQINGGLSAARNKGIAESTGKYLSFIDSDDWIDKDMFENMLSRINADNEIDIVVCGHRVVTESGITIETVAFSENQLFDREEATTLILKDDLMPSFAWNKIYRKSLFNNIAFPIDRIYEDTATIYKIFNLSRHVYVINNVYYNYLRRSNSICLNPKLEAKRAIHNFMAFYERYQFVKNHTEYASVLDTCAIKAFNLGTGCLHYMFLHKEIQYNDINRIIYQVQTIKIQNQNILQIFKRLEYYLIRCNLRLYKFTIVSFLSIKYYFNKISHLS